jgi:hypothetical protein
MPRANHCAKQDYEFVQVLRVYLTDRFCDHFPSWWHICEFDHQLLRCDDSIKIQFKSFLTLNLVAILRDVRPSRLSFIHIQ